MPSGKSAKKFRRAIRKEVVPIKVQGLKEFFEYSQKQKLRNRIAFCFKIIFKRL